MIEQLKRYLKKRARFRSTEIAPDEIFLDSTNLPQFDRHQFEGRIEKPISRKIIAFTGIFFFLIGGIFMYKVWSLQIIHGVTFFERSENNRLHHTIVFADRGVIYDRNKVLVTWNEANPADTDFPLRKYATSTGLSNILGYVKYPSKDSAGFYYREDYVGVDGVEKYYDTLVQGVNGIKIKETDVYGKVVSESTLNPPQTGKDLVLSIDSRIQSHLYNTIGQLSKDVGFTGGAGIIMDVTTGEIITEVTYPEYDSQVLTDGTDREKIAAYLQDKTTPLLDRSLAGLYTPGSIVKPFMALGALNEGVIGANDVIYTDGSLVLQSPYNPDQTFVYRDWKNHGPVDMREAISVSSDVYFYQIGGGFKTQKGIGIKNIEKYMKMFGFGEPIGPEFFGTKKGVIPNPEWKEKNFDGDIWRVGDTYHTVIGQYGFQVTPIQVVRAVAALANKGTLLEPTVIKDDTSLLSQAKKIDLPAAYFNVIHEGMKMAAETGTAAALNVPYTQFAAKTGTAELGVSKEFVNSWVTGFFPYEKPRYAFVILMEKGHSKNLIGASYVGRQLFDWMSVHTPEYFAE